jgi:hypothetical protein
VTQNRRLVTLASSVTFDREVIPMIGLQRVGPTRATTVLRLYDIDADAIKVCTIEQGYESECREQESEPTDADRALIALMMSGDGQALVDTTGARVVW